MQVTSTFVSDDCDGVQSLTPLIQSSVGNLKDLLSEFGGGLGFGSDKVVGEDGVVCTPTVPSFRPSRKDLRMKLFCNWIKVSLLTEDMQNFL